MDYFRLKEMLANYWGNDVSFKAKISYLKAYM